MHALPPDSISATYDKQVRLLRDRGGCGRLLRTRLNTRRAPAFFRELIGQPDLGDGEGTTGSQHSVARYRFAGQRRIPCSAMRAEFPCKWI